MKKITSILSILILTASTLFAQDCLNVDYKIRGYFYAGTSQVDTNALGGFYEDHNRPNVLSEKMNFFNPNKNTFQIIVETDSISEFVEGVKGFKVYVVNNTDSAVNLEAQDSRLYLKRQVFFNGKWQDIEYLPSSWCGNSYHTVFIHPKQYWEFTAPCLTGKIEAKFRFELQLSRGQKIYSNEFQGSFNKKQLSREQGHTPVGIMDPYRN